MRRVAALALFALTTTACSPADAPAPAPTTSADAATVAPPPAPGELAPAPAPCLSSLAAPTLPQPWDGGHGLDAVGARLDAAAAGCVLARFDGLVVRTPHDLDPAYAPLSEFHAEDEALMPAALPRDDVHLWRLSGHGDAGWWLLRIETGAPMEGGRHDIVFATGDDGQLRDQLLAGSDGALFRRDYDLTRTTLQLNEDTGRDEHSGPSYTAQFRLDDTGLRLVDSEVMAAADPQGDLAGDGLGDSGATLLTVPGRAGDLAALRRVLFADDSAIAEKVLPMRVGPHRAVLAIGGTDTAGQVVHVLVAADTQPDRAATQYVVASYQHPEPPGALSATPGTPTWEDDGDTVAIILPVRYVFAREGGNPDTGEREDYGVDDAIVLRWSPAEGRLAQAE